MLLLLAIFRRWVLIAAVLLAPLGASGAPLDQTPIDEARIRAAGIRRIESRHLILYTDLASNRAIDELPAVFDLAFPQWCEYFRLDAAQHTDWRMIAFLIDNKSRFKSVGLMPDDLPAFLHGYARGGNIWIYEQPTDYYRRHLLLHEGTHAFMNSMFGNCGPAWYMEGTAELLGSHRWQDGRLTLRVFPADKTQAPGWGRVKIIKDGSAARQSMPLAAVVALSDNAYLKNEPYGWSWAAAAFLDGHPRYRDRFREMFKDVKRADFNEQFFARFKEDWTRLAEEWQLFTAGIEYGYDLERMAIEYRPSTLLAAKGATVNIAADRGWQTSGVELQAGRTYRLRASGRFQVANQPKPWISEAGGVSIRYYGGRPLGILLAAVRPSDVATNGASALLSPTVVGQAEKISPQQTGTLYLRINDSPAELSDNSGTLRVEITAE